MFKFHALRTRNLQENLVIVDGKFEVKSADHAKNVSILETEQDSF